MKKFFEGHYIQRLPPLIFKEGVWLWSTTSGSKDSHSLPPKFYSNIFFKKSSVLGMLYFNRISCFPLKNLEVSRFKSYSL